METAQGRVGRFTSTKHWYMHVLIPANMHRPNLVDGPLHVLPARPRHRRNSFATGVFITGLAKIFSLFPHAPPPPPPGLAEFYITLDFGESDFEFSEAHIMEFENAARR